MKKTYAQPYVRISWYSITDILLASDDTNITDDDGWLIKGFEIKGALSASGGRFGSK